MQSIGFMGCIPKQFEEEYKEHTLQFLARIFHQFTER
jgi:hypothetical protein